MASILIWYLSGSCLTVPIHNKNSFVPRLHLLLFVSLRRQLLSLGTRPVKRVCRLLLVMSLPESNSQLLRTHRCRQLICTLHPPGQTVIQVLLAQLETEVTRSQLATVNYTLLKHSKDSHQKIATLLQLLTSCSHYKRMYDIHNPMFHSLVAIQITKKKVWILLFAVSGPIYRLAPKHFSAVFVANSYRSEI